MIPLPIFSQNIRRCCANQRAASSLEAETELFGFAVSGHPLELFADVAWDTYCPVSRLGEHIGETVVTCGLVVEQRTHHQITGEPMKFLTLADWTGMVETELFAQTYKSYGLATVRNPVWKYRDGRAVRERTGLFLARIAGGETKAKLLSKPMCELFLTALNNGIMGMV